MLKLTPAYDIRPQCRTGNEATQAMLIKGETRASTLATCLRAAPDFLLKEAEAAALISHKITTIAAHWHATCDEADLSPVDRKLFAGRQFLNEYALEDLTVRRPFTTFTRHCVRRLGMQGSGPWTAVKQSSSMLNSLTLLPSFPSSRSSLSSVTHHQHFRCDEDGSSALYGPPMEQVA